MAGKTLHVYGRFWLHLESQLRFFHIHINHDEIISHVLQIFQQDLVFKENVAYVPQHISEGNGCSENGVRSGPVGSPVKIMHSRDLIWKLVKDDIPAVKVTLPWMFVVKEVSDLMTSFSQEVTMSRVAQQMRYGSDGMAHYKNLIRSSKTDASQNNSNSQRKWHIAWKWTDIQLLWLTLRGFTTGTSSMGLLPDT